MKIDYDLVEKIGATHTGNGEYYAVDCDDILYYSRCDWSYHKSQNDEVWHVMNLTPIPPKPKTKVTYEKVTESIFDLKDEFERGSLYEELKNGTGFGKVCILNLRDLGSASHDGRLYHKVEKPVDWRDDIQDYLSSTYIDAFTVTDKKVKLTG